MFKEILFSKEEEDGSNKPILAVKTQLNLIVGFQICVFSVEH